MFFLKNSKTASSPSSLDPILLDKLEPITRKFVEGLAGSTPISEMSAEDGRKTLESVQSDTSYKREVDITEYSFGPEDVGAQYAFPRVTIKIFRQKHLKNDLLNAVVFLHGAGWVVGSDQTHGRLMSEFSVSASAIVYVGYTLAPEAQHPVQIYQALNAIQYIYQNAPKLKLDLGKLVLMGDSVGGHMAIATTIFCNYLTKNLRVHYLILMYPVTDPDMKSYSYKVFADGPWLTRKSMEYFYDMYLDKKSNTNANINDPALSPLKIPYKLLDRMPPTLVITAENDVLRDEGEEFAHQLMRAGVDVLAVRYLGTIHDFLMLDALKDTPAAKSARKLIADKLLDLAVMRRKETGEIR